MFVVLLKFADKSGAPTHMQGHNAWLQAGFDDGMFLLSGSLQPQGQGGAILAHASSRDQIEDFLAKDPFVQHGVVAPEILEIAATKFSGELQFLQDPEIIAH